MRERLRRLIEGALWDNGGLDYDLLTRTTEPELAEFIMETIWPEIQKELIETRLAGVQAGAAQYAEWMKQGSPGV